jgi:hypothetical protein
MKSLRTEESQMAERMVAHCGLICTECGAWKATRTMDQAAAASVAAEWSAMFASQVKVADVWCDGCLVEGKKCAHCAECAIRACALQHQVRNCGHCDEYACDKVAGLFAMAPAAKAVLDGEQARRARG